MGLKLSDPLYLGIDTSCYSTSVAVVDRYGKLRFDRRIMLPVEAGQKGMRQSQAFFYHHKNLPVLMEALRSELGEPLSERLEAIGVSEKPCRRQDSYMPVFLAGAGLARSLAAALDVPLFTTTHQEGHLMAALWSADFTQKPPFLAFHLSGGTTDLILVLGIRHKPICTFEYHLIVGSMDIPAGQLVDRIGVDLGLDFPAGPQLEHLAAELGSTTLPKHRIPTHVDPNGISFSGAEAYAKRLIAKGESPSEIARSIEHCIAGTLEKAVRLQPTYPVVFMGGVAGNGYVRQRLISRLETGHGTKRCYFAERQFSSDNAVGIALIAAASMKKPQFDQL